jgi:hypothetical protein
LPEPTWGPEPSTSCTRTPEACLAEAFERCAKTVLGRVEDAATGEEGDFVSRLATGLRELLNLLSSHPNVARLVLVEIRAGALAGLLALNIVESEDLAWVALWPRQGGQVGAAISPEVRAGEDEAPAKERPSKRRAGSAQRKRVQRERMLAAMIEIVGAKGYKAARVKDVPKRAGLWPLFSAHFSGKEDCMLAAFDTAISPIEERVRAAVASTASATGRAEAGLEALVASLAERPRVARLVAVEIRVAGAEGEKRYDEALARLVQLITGERAATRARTVSNAQPR